MPRERRISGRLLRFVSMFLFDLFRSFLPLHNPIGFGANDFIELALAALLVLLTFVRAEAEPFVQRVAGRTDGAWSRRDG